MKKHTDIIWHAFLVGGIAALVIVICGFFSMKAWIVFFAWANYFLHGSAIKKSMKMLLALFIGIILAFTASEMIGYIGVNCSERELIFVSASVVFVVAFILIFLEAIENWGEVVPASFLGTVLFFALDIKFSTDFLTTFGVLITTLILPLLVGIVAGWFTIVTREAVSAFLNK